MGFESGGRLARERAFHNKRFALNGRQEQGKYYWAIEAGKQKYLERIHRFSNHADIFELGCGMGDNIFANRAGFRSAGGIDISDFAIHQANEAAGERGLPNVKFFCGDAENVPLPDASLDLVFGSGIVHHLNLERCTREVSRLLRPGGIALFWEPLGHNPFINLYRRLTPEARTEDEHPLLRQDFNTFGRFFPSPEIEFFGLTSLATVPIRNIQALRWTRHVATSIDRLLFMVPCVKWSAWYSLITLRKPA
ncbi:MAG: methyltransferase domain-containing protein [Acetobacteraceae bacterium]|nr:methyltransferase domain-containing protein [Acetobacteraceae bacterium]